MTVCEFLARLSKFDPQNEVIFLPANDEGDWEYRLIAVDSWDIGKQGACAISLENPNAEIDYATSDADK